MTISVIVPCYKGERHIAGCLDNLLHQKGDVKLEIITVIDGNVDRSAEIARTYPVKVIVLEENQGISAARNIGFDAATGEYVHFMDVDDRVNDEFYANVAAAISRTNADVAATGMVNDEKAYKCQTFSKIREYTTARQKLSVTWVAKWGYVWRYVFRRSFLLEHDLTFEVGRYIEDMYFSIRALYFATKLVTVPGAVYHYVYTEDSILHTRDREWKNRLKQDWRHARGQIMEFCRQHGISAPGLPGDPGIVLYVLRKFGIGLKTAVLKPRFGHNDSRHLK